MFYHRRHVYYVYIVTNERRTVLYTGVSNNLEARIPQHYFNRGKRSSFAGRYNCYNLVYFEEFQDVYDAIAREKQIKKWNRKKKEELITSFNPTWEFLNKKICFNWPRVDNPSHF